MSNNVGVLYTFIRCPYAMRARLALAYATVSYEHREVDLKSKPAHLLEISPKGTVPVLLLNDGTVIEQSLDIMRWALKEPESAQQANDLINRNDNEFIKHLNHYKYPTRYPDDPNSIEFYRTEGERFLQTLEKHLNESIYLFGNNLSLADLAIFPFVRQFSIVEPEWFDKTPYTKLHVWLNSIKSQTFFNQAMQKFAVWKGNHDR